MQTLQKLRIFNGNSLKILAAIIMLVDHIGILFYPQELIWRIIGRISMPIFAFMIAEGCRYTRNKAKHFLLPFCLGVICQIVYYFFDNGSLYMCILITFSLSILVIYAMQYCKRCLFDKNASLVLQIFSTILFVGSIAFVYTLCQLLTIDYGFWGCMTPVFVAIFDFHQIPAPDKLKKLDVLPLRVACLAIALLLFHLNNPYPYLSIYAFLSLPFLVLYNGEKGKKNLKYFFYVFYPLHLALLQGLAMLLA